MKSLLTALVLAIIAAPVSLAQNVSGDWNGTLNTGTGELRLVLHITRNADGTLKATLDSIDQGANGIPVTSATLKDSHFSLKVDAVNGTYEGKVNPAATSIDGTWTQGAPLELNFHRGTIATKPAPIGDRRYARHGGRRRRVAGKRRSRNTQARRASGQPGLVIRRMRPLLFGRGRRVRCRGRTHVAAVTAGNKKRRADQRQKQVCQ